MPSNTTALAIVGAAGRMGTSLLLNAAESSHLEVTAAIVSDNDSIDEPLGPQEIEPSRDFYAIRGADVVVDFSAPEALAELAPVCRELGIPLVSGTTGLGRDEKSALATAGKEIAVLHAANFSVGINLLAHLVERAASGFGDDVDIEIFEAHHRHKVDAPSGTAKLLGRAAAAGRNLDLDSAATWTRSGHTGPRQQSEIGFQVLRGGDIVGEHTVYFCIDGERLELTHRASDRAIFARGALRASTWIKDKPAGRYDMNDVLFG